jgi:Flp pilus assembly pilin Flp
MRTGEEAMVRWLKQVRIWKDKRGQDLIEWVLLAGLFSAVAVAGIPPMAPLFEARFQKILSALPQF